MNKFDETYKKILSVIKEERDPYALDTFDYRMLSRLQSDCKYFLTMGYGYEKHLWTGNVEEQIEKMKEIYNKLPEKPVWCTWEDILSYEKQMKEIKAAKNKSNVVLEASMGPSYDPYYWEVIIGDKGIVYTGISKSRLLENIKNGIDNGDIEDGEYMNIYSKNGNKRRYIITLSNRGTVKLVKSDNNSSMKKMTFADEKEALRYLKDQKFEHVYERSPYFIVRTMDSNVDRN
jgi:hypothetical protein